MTLGLLEANCSPRLAFDQLSEAYHDQHLTSVPVGEARSDSPLTFLLYGFLLLLIFFLLMNIDRRFREYVYRALLRPFNFFADIRDQRLIPNFDTTLLGIVISGALALFFASLLYGFRQGYFANWLLGILFSSSTHAWLSGLAWHYIVMLLLFTLIFMGIILAITLILRFASIFVRGRLFLGDTYNITVWAFLPMIFLIPYDLILPRLDKSSMTVEFAAGFCGLLLLWSIYRLMKGTGVLFDIYPTKIYLYGTLALVVLLAISELTLELSTNIFSNYSFLKTVLSATELAP
jgi:hypothetical protein